MHFIFSVIVILLGLWMFRCPRPQKLVIFITSAMCFSLVTLPLPGFSDSCSFLTVCFILSEIRNISEYKEMLKMTVLWRLMIFMCIATLVLFLFSPHYRSLVGLFGLFKTELLTKYWVIAYAFVALREEEDLIKVYKGSLIGLTVLTLFAIANFAMGYSDYVNEMTANSDYITGMDRQGEGLGERYADRIRFRVQGMYLLAFDYGYNCAILFLFYWYGMIRNYISRRLAIYALSCCLFGVLTCNCRTVIFCLLISFFVFYYSQYGRHVVKYLIVLFVGFCFAYLSSSNISKMVDEKVVSIFVENDDVGGSSFAMRAVQYGAVLSHVQGYELVGRGKDYFNIDLGWLDGRQFLVDDRLEGIEGILLNLLLERGLLGIFFWFFFYLSLFLYIKRNRHLNNNIASLGMAYIAYYFVYANMTGEMGCVYPTMLHLGIVVNGLALSDNQDQELTEQELAGQEADQELTEQEAQQELSSQEQIELV